LRENERFVLIVSVREGSAKYAEEAHLHLALKTGRSKGQFYIGNYRKIKEEVKSPK